MLQRSFNFSKFKENFEEISRYFEENFGNISKNIPVNNWKILLIYKKNYLRQF